MKKIVKNKIETVLNIITGVIPNLQNIQVKIEGAEWDPKNKNISIEEINIDFNLMKKT
jgi:hypothetical protein